MKNSHWEHVSQIWVILSTAVKLQYVHMDAITKAKTFCKQHFQMHFYEWKINIPKDSIDELALVLVMAWSREVTKTGHYLDQW